MEEFIWHYRVVALYEELAQTEKKETMLGPDTWIICTYI